MMTGNRRPLMPGRICPCEGKSLSSIAATVPICTPLTLTGAPTLSPLRLPWNMQMKRIGPGEHLARADYDQGHDQDRKAGDHKRADNRWTDPFTHDCLLSRLPLVRG